MGSLNNAPSWADQWGTGNAEDDHKKPEEKKEAGAGSNKMAKLKSFASTGLDKAKVAATTGASKVKAGTSSSFKWVKTHCQKNSSK